MASAPAKVVVHVDGGARGNPGPAAVAAVVSAADGRVLEEQGVLIGRATNNVAEYRALLLGIELVGDSELIVRQVNGEYKVKDPALRELSDEVRQALAGFESWTLRHVRREQNAEADRLVNATLDEAA